MIEADIRTMIQPIIAAVEATSHSPVSETERAARVAVADVAVSTLACLHRLATSAEIIAKHVSQPSGLMK